MPKIVQEILMFVVVLAMTIGLAYFGYSAYSKYKDQAQSAIDNGDKLINEMTNDIVTRYEAEEVTGSEVISVIKHYKNEKFGVIVTIGTTNTNYAWAISGNDTAGWTLGSAAASGSLESAKDITKTSTYINPTKSFVGAVLYDVNGNPVGLHFTLK